MEAERAALRAAEPLLGAAERCIREDERRLAASETGIVLEVLEGLRQEQLAGAAAVPILKLAVAGAKIEAAVERAARRAGLNRVVDFRGWVQEHLPGGAGALHRFTNQDNASKCLVDEVFLDGGVLCTAEELMEHRVQVWTGLWWQKDEAANCPEVRTRQLELARQSGDLGSDEEMFPLEAIRKCVKGAAAKAALGSDQWRPHDIWARV